MTESPAIRQSRARLAKAEEALARLEAAANLDEAESAWSDLLLAGNGVYSKLEQGAKVSGKATAWYGRAKKARKDDPLLSYLHHARNSDEHSIEEITHRRQAGEASFAFEEPLDLEKLANTTLSIDVQPSGRVIVHSTDENVISTEMYPEATIVLITVNDVRYNDRFMPPREHLGKKLESNLPAPVAKHFISYLETLIAEAETFGV